MARKGPKNQNSKTHISIVATALAISFIFTNGPSIYTSLSSYFTTGSPLTSKSSGKNTRICLNIIAKNEAGGIVETLKAAERHISGWTICDTGSTDNTVEVVEEFFNDKKDIKGQVVHHQWKNFAHNKNMCMQAARETLGDWCQYFLILDADQVLRNDNDIDLSQSYLTEDGYYLQEESHGAGFANIRLVKAGRPWKYLGSVHEYINSVGFNPMVGTLPDGIYTKHDANLTIGRFERDEFLLKQELAETPENARSQFYLAQTYVGLEKPDDAIINYVKRIELNGWEEEVYLSYMRIAELLEKHYYVPKKDVPESVLSYVNRLFPKIQSKVTVDDIIEVNVKAHETVRYRQESLYHLARIHRQYLSDTKGCYEYAMKARSKGDPKKSTLFTDVPVIKYHVDNEICVCAHYETKFKQGIMACYRLETSLQNAKDYGDWHANTLKHVQAAMQMYSSINLGEGEDD